MSVRRLAYSILFILLPLVAQAQFSERKDSLVRLLGCDKLQLEEVGGHSFRKALGNARFEHNATKLICDTALWDVDANVIKAIGHVRIIQNRTVLTSDNLDYYIGSSLAEFRGSLVQLQDKDRNTLRTRNLDYDTADSVAIFRNGGSFRDKDGQIIESDVGRYDAKTKTFRFYRDVNMYTDSVFVKTDDLDFNTETSVAVFGTGTHAWRGDNMLSANAGSYNRAAEVFTFTKNVHLLTLNQEAWSDTLVYERAFNNAEMFGNVELLDTTRNVTAVAGYMQYVDSLERIRMLRDPSVIAVFEQNGTKDTVYVRGDELLYWAVPRNEVSENEVAKSRKRMEELAVDPVSEYRRKAYEAAVSAAEEAKRKREEEDPNFKGSRPKGGPYSEPLWRVSDLSAPPVQVDSLDSELSDSTKIGFLYALRNVKVFRKDMQVVCDSLEYNDLDSLVRLYRSPVVWNEIRRQYSADSITVVLKNRALDKASLMSNAFIVVQEDSLCFDQIRGTEMMAYFDSTGTLRRFDSMGGASGLFFLEEKGAFATVNKFEAKMLSAAFIKGNINDLVYYEQVKSDAYPAVQLKKDERILKGFEWQPEKRPKGPEDIVAYTPRKTERARYESVPHAKFAQTEIYFPGHIANINKMLASADSLKRAREAERKAAEELRKAEEALAAQNAQEAKAAQEAQDAQEAQEVKEEKVEGQAKVSGKKPVEVTGEPTTPKESIQSNKPTEALDSLGAAVSDSLAAVSDSLAAAKLLAREKFVADSLKTAKMDSLRRALTADLDAERALKKAQRDAKRASQDSLRQARAAKKEAKWAALDAKDAEKAARKAEKKAESQRLKLKKMLKAKAKSDAREQKFFERYKARYEKKKARQDAAALKKKH
ncbi:MAG: hypothetical protein IKW89_04480 [Bacteroidales bacterium]|nr:hypothetical protein [Bacteroidales bacterium]